VHNVLRNDDDDDDNDNNNSKFGVLMQTFVRIQLESNSAVKRERERERDIWRNVNSYTSFFLYFSVLFAFLSSTLAFRFKIEFPFFFFRLKFGSDQPILL